MAMLNFSESVTIKGQDEIGELGTSLNHLADKLEVTLQSLQDANDKLKSEFEIERKNEEIRKSFMMAVSHELKSPLAAAMGQVEAMKYNIKPYNDHTKYLGVTYQILEKMASLINEMLDITKQEQSPLFEQTEVINLSDLLTKVLTSKQSMPNRTHFHVYTSIDEGVTIKGNRKMMRKILENIVENAFLYSTSPYKIHITLSISDGLKICNSAKKVSESDVNDWFKPFYRMEKSGNSLTGGHGLGLFITARLLDFQNLSHYGLLHRKGKIIFWLKLTAIMNQKCQIVDSQRRTL